MTKQQLQDVWKAPAERLFDKLIVLTLPLEAVETLAPCINRAWACRKRMARLLFHPARQGSF